MKIFIRNGSSKTGRFVNKREKWNEILMINIPEEKIIGKIEAIKVKQTSPVTFPRFIDCETGYKKDFEVGEFDKAVRYGRKYFNTHRYQVNEQYKRLSKQKNHFVESNKLV